MTIKVRLSGEPDDIKHLLRHLQAEFDVAGSDRAYPNRGSFGVRVYLELRQAAQSRRQSVKPEVSSRKDVEP